jgi:hypothetical protein
MAPMIGSVVALRPLAIQRLGAAVDRRLRAVSGAVGRVHSVFERAVNVSCADGRLITFHGPGPLAAPFAASVDRVLYGSLLIAPGAKVARSGSELRMDDIVIRWQRAAIVSTAIEPHPDARALAAALGASALGAPATALTSPTALSAQHWLGQGLRTGDLGAVVAGACALIGLGEGLTPAGDDFLVGTLAVVRRLRPDLLEHADDAAAAISRAASLRTTDVGREFLLHAIQGEFSELVVAAVSATRPAEARDALARLLANGATSGADAAAGMRLALAALAT